jgi:D-glycerate 3-kinase
MTSKLVPAELKEKLFRKFLEILPPQGQQEVRVRDYYLKILGWVVQEIEKSQVGPLITRPLIIGVNGPQGSGKSTLTVALVQVLSEMGFRGLTLSIDDFYLTRKQQIAIASQYPFNPLLQQRGYPGTHDIQLGLEKLAELRKINATRDGVRIPCYDKSKHQGQGDRLPEAEWTEIRGPLDVVFLEGWMLGFRGVPESVISSNVGVQADPRLNAGLLEINRLLDSYQAWYGQLDAFIHLIPLDIKYVIDWRVEAEERMKAQGKPGMSREDITSYIHKFILAYEIYLPQLIARPILPGRTLQLVLSKERLLCFGEKMD